MVAPPRKNGETSCCCGVSGLFPVVLLQERRQGDEVVLLEIVDGLAGQVADQVDHLARLDVLVLDGLEGLLPIVAEAHFVGGAQHLLVAPGELVIGERDQLVRRVGNHGGLQGIEQRIVAGRSNAGEFFVAAEGSAGCRVAAAPRPAHRRLRHRPLLRRHRRVRRCPRRYRGDRGHRMRCEAAARERRAPRRPSCIRRRPTRRTWDRTGRRS